MGKITKQRSFALVGEFMGEWAAAELMVDDAIAEALDLDLIQYLVIGSKLSVRNKLEILARIPPLSGGIHLSSLSDFLGPPQIMPFWVST